MEVVTVITFDQQNKRWQASWTDSEHGMQLLYDGATNAFGLDLRMARSIEERTLTLQRLFTFETPRSFAWESARSMDGGATWDVTASARYTKR